MTRLKILHRTAYRYNKRVTLSYNEARMTPLTEPQQVVLESQVRVAPAQASVSTYKDYWGTRVTAFDMQMPHDFLEVVSSTTVEVHRVERVPVEGEVVPWERLHSPEVEDQFSDWLPQSRLSGPGTEVLGIVPGLVEGLDPNQAAHAVFDWMSGEMRYMPGSTGVTTDAEQAWNQREGVCQDLAHLAIGSLRSLGIPARYISGYLHPRSGAGIGEVVAGQSHAWLEWWDGEWRSWDPTNHKPAGDFHVTVARGRDYRDVPPLKGVLSGGEGSHLEVSVELTRVA
ncbi:transglutaminase family protein [Sinomonas notoginsengisoli]|uniref:transglutaminase family protein n=1 Tax=Sinomonas notoginsengisoli TaxID=1457311 RepID=UPI001F412152|nr:transglutaminase family protein [Sinomonas notoginsengisoli]